MKVPLRLPVIGVLITAGLDDFLPIVRSEDEARAVLAGAAKA